MASQVKGAQVWVWTGGQLPAPSQKATRVEVDMPAGQLAARHWVLGPHLRQAPIPSQVPSSSQVDWAVATQPAPGSARPAGTFTQVPT